MSANPVCLTVEKKNLKSKKTSLLVYISVVESLTVLSTLFV